MHVLLESEGDEELIAFKILCEILTPKNIKNSIDYIYMEYQV